jgi:hypothetical protein
MPRFRDVMQVWGGMVLALAACVVIVYAFFAVLRPAVCQVTGSTAACMAEERP